MSLLNDALRAAEQRQKQPVAPGAYVGEQRQSRSGSPFLVVVVIILALLIAVMGGYWILAGRSSQEPVVVQSEPSQDQRVQRDAAVVVDDAPVREPVETMKPVSPTEVVEAAPLQEPDPAPAPEVAEPEASAPEPVSPPAPSVAETPSQREATTTEAEPEQPEDVSTAGVKQVPETPTARDRRTARDLERLVAQGNITDAERGLAALTQQQSAPRSRYVVARALLVEGRQNQALGWLPEDITAVQPTLRLLRARALHANNDLAAAVSTLSSTVPPVEDHAEYRVTLATLLQQQGANTEAARHWAELIAWDDSQAPWWVGLAISLEAQGQQAGAARAYRQAAELPGLPRSLADYVQQRLQALRAG